MRIYVPLTREALDALRERAERNRRFPKDEAAVLIEHALGFRPWVDSGEEVSGQQEARAAACQAEARA